MLNTRRQTTQTCGRRSAAHGRRPAPGVRIQLYVVHMSGNLGYRVVQQKGIFSTLHKLYVYNDPGVKIEKGRQKRKERDKKKINFTEKEKRGKDGGIVQRGEWRIGQDDMTNKENQNSKFNKNKGEKKGSGI